MPGARPGFSFWEGLHILNPPYLPAPIRPSASIRLLRISLMRVRCLSPLKRPFEHLRFMPETFSPKIADNYPPSAHNQSMNRYQSRNVFLFPVPYSLCPEGYPLPPPIYFQTLQII